MKRGNLIRVTAAFFAVMLLFTILSRAAYQSGTAVVVTARPESRMITHQVTAVGKTKENREIAVSTEPGLRVSAICVQEGERVEKGDVLFELDTELLDETIQKQKHELEKQALQTDDAKSAKSARAARQSNAVAEAQENAALARNRANAAYTRAQRAVEEARRAQDSGAGSGAAADTSEVEEALRNAVAEADAALEAANQALLTLEWRIEQAVDEALRAAQEAQAFEEARPLAQRQTLEKTRPLAQRQTLDKARPLAQRQIFEPTQRFDVVDNTTGAYESTWITCGEEESPDYLGLSDYDVGLPDYDAGLPDYVAGLPNYDEELSDYAAGLPDYDAELPDYAAGLPDYDAELPDADAGLQGSDEELPGYDGEIPDASLPGREITQEELDEIERQVRESYSLELAAAKENVELAETGCAEANAALAQYQSAFDAISQESSEETQRKLDEAVKSAQENLDDAARGANEAAVNGNRAIATAELPEGSDSSDRIAEITQEQMELELAKLEKLQKAEGKVRAPGDGLVTKIDLRTGDRTTDGTAMLLTDLAQGCHFAADLTKEQEKYIGTGDLVTITSDNQKQKAEDIPVSSVRADEEDASLYHVTVQLPEDLFTLGVSATLEYTKKSRTYSLCVPLTALRVDDRNQPYVLVPDTFQSIMGTELRARKVQVTVIEKNDKYAALEEGALAAQDAVIIQADRTVEEGSRVRVSS